LQELLEVLLKAVGVARECRLNNPTHWPGVIEAINDLLPEEDMGKFKEFCKRMEYGLGKCDADHVEDLKMDFDTNDEEEEDDNSDNVRVDWFEENETESHAHDGYLAQEMWKVYKDWLSNRLEELGRFKEFMVRSCSFIIFV
jgi:hypothetical protein